MLQNYCVRKQVILKMSLVQIGKHIDISQILVFSSFYVLTHPARTSFKALSSITCSPNATKCGIDKGLLFTKLKYSKSSTSLDGNLHTTLTFTSVVYTAVQKRKEKSLTGLATNLTFPVVKCKDILHPNKKPKTR